MADLAGPQSLGEMGPSSKPKLGNNSFAWYMAIPKKIRWIISVIVVVAILFGAVLGAVEVYNRYVQRQVHSFIVWGKGLLPSDDASTSVAKKDEVNRMPSQEEAPDLNVPGSNPKAPPKVLQERRPPPGTPESTRTAVATAAAAKASTAAPVAAKASIAAPTASATTVVAGASASVAAEIATLKQEVAHINKWKEDQSQVTLNLARDVGEMKKTSASAEISALAARLTTQETETKRLKGGQRRIESGQNEIVGRMARMDDERIAAVRQGLAVKLARNPEAILSASGPAETSGVPSANEPVVRSLRPATVSGGCVVNCGKKGK